MPSATKTSEEFERLTGRPGRPAAMAPFDAAARRIAAGRWPEATETTDRPIVAAVCNLAPLELVHAAGALPVRLCAGSVCDHGSSGPKAARDTCGVVKGLPDRLRALEEAVGRAAAAVLVPATCDWKTRSAQRIDAPERAVVLDLPRDKSIDRVRDAWRKKIAELADFLGRTTGVSVRRRNLRRSIEMYQQASYIGRRLAETMKQPSPPLAGADLMLAFNLYYYLPVETWSEWATTLFKEVRDRSDSADSSGNSPRPRILLAGAPIIWPNWWLPILIEESGGRIVADSLCSSYRGFSDLVSVDETNRAALIQAVADRYLLPCTCPCFAPNEEFLWRLEVQAKDYAIEGVVIHRLRNCYLFDMETQRMVETFKRLELPVLTVESDYESLPIGALTTRVEAFLDLLQDRRTS